MTKEENEKLTLLLTQFAQFSGIFSEKMAKLDEVTNEVKELNRTLRGHNGTPGLLTQFELSKQTVSQIQTSIDYINKNGCLIKPKETEEEEKNISSKIEEHAPTFKWFRENFVIPITVAFIVGLINTVVIAKYIVSIFTK